MGEAGYWEGWMTWGVGLRNVDGMGEVLGVDWD